MTDADLLALCCFKEASTEPDDGLAAVARVILNRQASHFQSDGTIPGTVLHGDGAAFSWVAFDFVGGHYTRVASGPAEIAARAAQALQDAQRYPAAWGRAQRISAAVADGSYRGGALYGKLTSDVVLYLNPAIVHPLPEWADPKKLVCSIARHSFYTA